MAGYMDLFQDVCNCVVMKFVFSLFFFRYNLPVSLALSSDFLSLLL